MGVIGTGVSGFWSSEVNFPLRRGSIFSTRLLPGPLSPARPDSRRAFSPPSTFQTLLLSPDLGAGNWID